MQIGLRLHDSAKVEFEKRIENVHNQGFKCVHLAMSKIEGLTWDDAALTPGYAAYLKHAFDKQQLDIAVLGCYKNLADPDEAKLTATIKKYITNIRFGAMLGVGVVGTETGNTNTEYKTDPADWTSTKALNIFIKNLRTVVEAAEKFGVNFAIEPVWKHIVCTPERALTVLKEISSPNLSIILDPVNLVSPAKYEARNDTIANAINLLGDYVSIIHIKDCVLENGDVKSIGAGEGDMDYTQILEFAKARKPYIQATLENTKPETAEKSRLFIQNQYDKL